MSSQDSVQVTSSVDVPPEIEGEPPLEAEPLPPEEPAPVKPVKKNKCVGCLIKTRDFLRQNLQTVLIICGVILGICFGLILRAARQPWTDREIMYVGLIGSLFLAALKGITIPLIVTSIIAAVGTLDVRLLGRIGGRAMTYYLLSTCLSVCLGIGLSMGIQPGKGAVSKPMTGTPKPSLTEDIIFDMFRQLFPENVIQAALQSWQTNLEYPDTTGQPGTTGISTSTMNITASPETTPKALDYRLYKVGGDFRWGINIIGLMVFSLVLGVALSKLEKKGRPALKLADAIAEAIIKITNWIIWISPVGIFSILSAEMLKIKDFSSTGKSVGLYIGTSMAGFFIHSLITLPLLYSVFVCKLPFRYIINSFPAIIMALSTSSSLATLPVTIKCLEDKNKMDKRITRFVLPIGANINMDGMALYEAVAVVFLAQVTGADLSAGKIIALSLISTLASIGASGIPSAGIIMTLIVLNSVGIPADNIHYIIATDWILDRFSTAVNVMGDCIATGVVGKWCLKDLIKFDQEEQEAAAARENPGGEPLPVGSADDVDLEGEVKDNERSASI